MESPPTAGIDIGAVTTKGVIIAGEKVVAHAVIETGPGVKKSALDCLNRVVREAGLSRSSLSAVAATGYGRSSLPCADRTITEITCHARGASHLFPGTETVIDIGGQDSKIIFLENGRVRDFVMNDKCAAGTGRFLEVMARVLALPLDEKVTDDETRKKGDEPEITLSSTCTVFAESEVISLLTQGVPRRRILCALHKAIAARILALARGQYLGKNITLTGGVAKNHGVAQALQRRLGIPLFLPPEPQLTGAYGAALLVA